MSDPLLSPHLETRVAELEDTLRLVQQELVESARRYEELARAHDWLRRRLASFYPERHYCPECKALLHPTATACRCGWTSGPQRDPKAGLPR